MATARKIQLTPAEAGVFSTTKPTQESADAASRILQENHEKFNLFFNESGFHNHIVHEILTLYGLGAPPAVLDAHYATSATYQMKPKILTEANVAAMSSPEGFQRFLGDRERTHDYMEFFQREIAKRGVEEVVLEYLFSGSEIAEDMFVRLFMGFLHPLIHLGFGLEFKQPVIVAEALAETAVHENWLTPFFLGAEKAARETQSDKTLPQLLDEIRADKKISTAAEYSQPNKIRDGILLRAAPEMTRLASQFRVPPALLPAKTAEMLATAVFFTAAAQRPPGKPLKLDFFYMHATNASVFWPTLNALPWLSDAQKCRLLEWKARGDLVLYASRGCPALLREEIDGGYAPKVPGGAEGAAGWRGLAERLYKVPKDDGHAVKLLRAVAVAEGVCAPYEGEKWERVGKGGWKTIGNMVVDCVEDADAKGGSPWVRGVGFAEAWGEVEDGPRKEVEDLPGSVRV